MMKKISKKLIHSECIICKNKLEFDLPKELLDAFLSGEVVIFAGAGISTENRTVLPETFYEEIASEVGHNKFTLPFSEIMERFCKKTNGRIELLSRIKKRFDTIKAFPELAQNATRFHQEIATFPQIKTIITTNWDTFFETECGAIPLVNSEDLMFWDTDERKVIKIHGSIDSFGSIIATKKDYNKCLRELHKKSIGGTLKNILATKTIVYFGYSFSDEDFNQILGFIRKDMKGFTRQSYIVTLDKVNDQKYKKLNLKPIYTDAPYFLSTIKEHAVHKKILLPDALYDVASYLLKIVNMAHAKLTHEFNCFEHPEIIYSLFYQDGIKHAYERVLALKKTGKYSCQCLYLNAYKAYTTIIKKYLKKKRYEEVAYAEGFLAAHLYLLFFFEKDKKSKLPLYYAFGYKYDLISLEDFKKILKKIPYMHKGAYSLAKKMAGKYKNTKDLILHHPAYFLP